ncbi:pseudouridine synthase [Dunaliella salina]|uniref:Pseudouridine synthase n=1 Tax=Dunaliella salina TaxID=3046 RepID=A0ABQ7GF64_DUNSA|nr:pseudouridine synthase [Dunaliella salina]|eukprot:KAF5833246.1 pseudouridine synthase [Dunaliella salina]
MHAYRRHTLHPTSKHHAGVFQPVPHMVLVPPLPHSLISATSTSSSFTLSRDVVSHQGSPESGFGSSRSTRAVRPCGCSTTGRSSVSCGAKHNWAGGGDARELGLGAQELQNYHRLKMSIAYDGAEFAGFQFQPVKVRTVQGELEKAATRLFLGCSRMVGASRTDAGAHANGQVAHFDVHGQRDSLESDLMMFNGFLPPDVKVLDISYAEPGARCCGSAKPCNAVQLC